MFRRNSLSVLILSLLVSLFLANSASTQDNPVIQARAAGLYGIAPVSPTELEQVVWERYGIYFQEYNRRAYVAGLKPGGAAAQQGAKVGDVLRGSDVMGALASLQGTLRGFENILDRSIDDGSITLHVYDADSRWQRDYRLTPSAADGEVVGLPQALRSAATSYPGLMAIVSGDPTHAEPREVARDAMLALQAISKHVRNCSGVNAVSIPVRITVTETTTDGLGVYRGSETSDYDEVLRVRPEFANWARANIGLYPTQAVSTVRDSVLELISQEDCAGYGFRQLETGLAAIMGATLPDAPESLEHDVGAIPKDPRGFIRQCYPLMMQEQRGRGSNPSERGTATICTCEEHAARSVGDAELYTSLRIRDVRRWEAIPELHARFTAAFEECYRAPEGSEWDLRIKAIWREMGL